MVKWSARVPSIRQSELESCLNGNNFSDLFYEKKVNNKRGNVTWGRLSLCHRPDITCGGWHQPGKGIVFHA